jgi:hypothetical protein
MVYDIVEGTSDSLQFQLLENGSPIDLSLITVSLLLSDRLGNAVTTPGTVSIVDAANGKVQFTPTSLSTFAAVNGPCHARWKLTNNLSGAVGYVPTTTRDIWNIQGQ